VGLSDVFDWTRRMKGKGLQVENRRIDRQELMRYKRSFTEPVPKSREEMFAKAGIEASMVALVLPGHPQSMSATTFWRDDMLSWLLDGNRLT
jgi:transcription initiation factor TFIIIB Brf1 subunit/transcription initiation factor TFIIB